MDSLDSVQVVPSAIDSSTEIEELLSTEKRDDGDYEVRDVDICFTCLTAEAPSFPLRQELPTLGFEVIDKMSGIGRRAVFLNGVRNEEDSKRSKTDPLPAAVSYEYYLGVCAAYLAFLRNHPSDPELISTKPSEIKKASTILASLVCNEVTSVCSTDVTDSSWSSTYKGFTSSIFRLVDQSSDHGHNDRNLPEVNILNSSSSDLTYYTAEDPVNQLLNAESETYTNPTSESPISEKQICDGRLGIHPQILPSFTSCTTREFSSDEDDTYFKGNVTGILGIVPKDAEITESNALWTSILALQEYETRNGQQVLHGQTISCDKLELRTDRHLKLSHSSSSENDSSDPSIFRRLRNAKDELLLETVLLQKNIINATHTSPPQLIVVPSEYYISSVVDGLRCSSDCAFLSQTLLLQGRLAEHREMAKQVGQPDLTTVSMSSSIDDGLSDDGSILEGCRVGIESWMSASRQITK